MTATQQGIRLSGTELLGCWTALDLGPAPIQLRARPPGATIAESRALLRQAVAGLAARGLTDPVDDTRPHPELAGMLRVIATAERHLDIWFTDRAATTLFGLGAQAGVHGVVLAGPETNTNTQTGNSATGVVRLMATDSTRVAATLLGLAGLHGSIRPGVGVPVNIPVDAFETACHADKDGSLWALADRLTEQGVPGQDARSLARMCGDITVTGQLGATARHGEREQRSRWVIGFHGTARGWFLQLRRDSTITVCPTDTRGLMRQWHELIKALPPPR